MKKKIALLVVFSLIVMIFGIYFSGCSMDQLDKNNDYQVIMSPTPEQIIYLPLDPKPSPTSIVTNNSDIHSTIISITKEEKVDLICDNKKIDLQQIADKIKNDFNDKYVFNVQFMDNNQKYWFGNYYWKIYWDWHYVSGCIKKNVHHLNFIINNSTISNKPIIDVHICFWWDNGPQIGVYNSGLDKFCFTSEGTFTAFKEKLQNLIMKCAPTMPIVVASTIAAVVAYIVIACIPVALAANDENTGESNIINDSNVDPIDNFPLPVLPDIDNNNVLPISEPSPPPPEDGVEDTYRATKKSWGITEFEGTKYAIHTGVNNNKMYLGKCDKYNRWSNWIELDGETNDAVDICMWRGRIVVVHRGKDGTIYVGMINIDFTKWSGWKSTGRGSKFAPVLASDGANIALVHDGSNNDKIYYNCDINNWFNNANWKETPRTSHARVGAAMYEGTLWIAHLGFNETKIYVGNVKDNIWTYTNRDSKTTPALSVYKNKKMLGHQGLDGKNYFGIPNNPEWPAVKEVTTFEPKMCILSDNYIGYAFVNLYSMRLQQISVTTPQAPPPEVGVEDIGRTSGLAWSFTSYPISGTNQIAGIHVGSERNGLLYLGIRNNSGIWNNWNPAIEYAYTDKPASVIYYKNQIVIAYTDAVNNIWVGTMNIDKTGWSGWHFTGRSSTHGAILATDGTYIYLVHKGSTNNKIYYNSDFSNWFDNTGWKETSRSTNMRFAAAAYSGKLYIAHTGENNTKIYWGNVIDNIWYDTNRDTISGPAITIFNGIVWIGHRGLTDNKNYVLNTSSKICYTLKERTQSQPFLGVHKGILKYGYLYYDSMRLQDVK